MTILGLILAVLAVVIVSFLTLLLYFAIDRGVKKHGAKDLNIAFIVIVFLATLVIHFFCIFEKIGTEDDIVAGIFNGIKAIYRQLGSLTFEGFDEHDITDGLVFLYLASTLWMALTNALLISIGVSYEFRCKLRFLLKRFNFIYWGVSKRSIYIFSIISDDALTLAESIRKDADIETRDELINGINDKKRRKNRPLIIFAGDEIGPFDKTNELHQKIRMCDYYFFSFAKKEKKNDKNNQYRMNHLLYRIFFLKLLSKCALFNILTKQDVHIFALAKDKDDKGLESKNSDIIFDDIKALAPRLFEIFYGRLLAAKKEVGSDDKDAITKAFMTKNFTHITYHVLVNNEINYEFFAHTLDKQLSEVCDYFIEKGVIKEDKDPEVMKQRLLTIKSVFSSLFVIDAICEPVASAEDLILKKQEKLPDDLKGCLSEVGDRYEMNYAKDNIVKALVIGFGSNGQQALGHLYADSIGGVLDPSTKAFFPNKFHADVLDKEIDDVIAPFMSAHPLFAFKEGTLKDGAIPYYDKVVEKDPETGKDIVKEVQNKEFKRIKDFYNGHKAEDLDLLMSFPQVFYRKENFNSAAFMNTIDDVVNYKYDYVIITLGDDERNISCANTLLQTIRQTINAKNVEKKTLSIFINIRNKDNNYRVNWNEEEDEILFNNLVVRVFGNASDIYSSRLLKFNDAASIDTAYNEINRIGQYKQTPDDRRLAYNQFLSLSIYEKKTNSAACIFGKFYYLYISKLPKEIKDALANDLNDYESYLEKPLDEKFEISGGLTLERKEINGKKYFEFLGNNAETIQKNIIATRNSGLDEKKRDKNELLPQSFASYFRFRSAFNYNEEDANCYFNRIGKYWYYFAQFDHNRWCRHMIMYGRSYSSNFRPIYESEETREKYSKSKDSKYLEKRWKNIYLLSDCVIPYSSFINFNEKAATLFNYLRYHEEDYDYDIFRKAYRVNENWYNKLTNKE